MEATAPNIAFWLRRTARSDAYDSAGAPGPETLRLHVADGGQHLRHPRMPDQPLPRP
ncbi:hypothetical protein O7599_16400 [Streptomyces sp. WMMC500]|uniref:hypothetical protein n=1 Tax=Streptomyces sp. WMMC500 TaxID=3015154 RepID=UPI00248CE720|nr:hypothetical protein [Streptomyces sp. WMMC500]WBB64799.1 hypothetical protein O7599_16400 [Streptomyces sp. WMMC500]